MMALVSMFAFMLIPIWIPLITASVGFVSDRLGTTRGTIARLGNEAHTLVISGQERSRRGKPDPIHGPVGVSRPGS